MSLKFPKTTIVSPYFRAALQASSYFFIKLLFKMLQHLPYKKFEIQHVERLKIPSYPTQDNDI